LARILLRKLSDEFGIISVTVVAATCFALQGESEVVEVDLEVAFGKESEGKMTKVWKCKEERWKEG
jgi:hypothetical protein